MAPFARSKAALELGKRLVEHFDDGDLLTSWMAHYIAERIHAADIAAPENKEAIQDECVRAILDLWRHRANFSPESRLFRELEPILRVLASLDMDSSDYRYYPAALRAAEGVVSHEETTHWLNSAIGIDRAARLLIRYALRAAVEPVATDAAPWVSLAQAAGAEIEPELSIIRLARTGQDPDDPPASPDVKALNDKLQKLESFIELAEAMAAEMRHRLAEAQTSG